MNVKLSVLLILYITNCHVSALCLKINILGFVRDYVVYKCFPSREVFWLSIFSYRSLQLKFCSCVRSFMYLVYIHNLYFPRDNPSIVCVNH